ncbi:MAG TPA: hypothetical protein VK629_01560 [Steroidobacteraceae bacterium]|nr:hypothetical protein [Steroidobacteraceae bacterium]
MLNAIEIIERLGQDPELRYADKQTVRVALQNADVPPSISEAILNADMTRLEELVGAAPNVCCGLYPVEGGQKAA